jgi:spore maturation protein CgeB
VKIAIISDKLTQSSLQYEDNIELYDITPQNYKQVLTYNYIDFLFVESAWHGYNNSWKYKIASYENKIFRSNYRLKKVIKYAKSLEIPTVFWNKEDGIHFDRFIDSAKLFDHIFTVDENSIPKYKQIVPKSTTVNTLMFAIQPKIHNFTGFNFRYNSANFVGSYSHHIHNHRRNWQDMMFESITSQGMDLIVYDRNSGRKSPNYRYPDMDHLIVKPAIRYHQTAQIYKDYILSLNVNTIEDSPSMFSRRLIEILACGGISVTNPTKAVNIHFKDFCHIIHSQEEMDELIYRIHKFGLTSDDKDRAYNGAMNIAKYHTWSHRLQDISKVIGISD